MRLDDKPRLEAITERDIDVLLMEEFVSGSGFLEWFAGKTARWSLDELHLRGVWHSASNEHGESDLIVLAGRIDGERLALLIENKVAAPPQPEQAARYQRRGEIGLADGDWQQYATCLVAPARYLGSSANAAGYHATVSYEDVADWMHVNLPAGPRSEFKRNLILGAIEQQRRGYSPTVDPVVTRFFTEYWEFSESLFPELRFSHVPSRATGSTWAEFRPKSLPRGLHIIHKVPEGWVDLQIAGLGTQTENLNRLNPMLIETGLQFVQTHKSASLRVEVRKMDSREDFTSQREFALLALKSAFRLMSLAHVIRTE